MTDKIRIALIMDSISRHNIILTTSISESEEGKKDLRSLGTLVSLDSLALRRVPIEVVLLKKQQRYLY